MEDRETPRMHKYRESKKTRIMMATVRHVTSSSGLTKISGRLIFVVQTVPMLYNIQQVGRLRIVVSQGDGGLGS